MRPEPGTADGAASRPPALEDLQQWRQGDGVPPTASAAGQPRTGLNLSFVELRERRVRDRDLFAVAENRVCQHFALFRIRSG